MKKIFIVVLLVFVVMFSFGCGVKIKKNNEFVSINLNEYDVYDFEKMSKEDKARIFKESFDIEYTYVGLPESVVDNSEMNNVLKNTVTGNFFLEEFLSTVKPYLIYDVSVKAKDGVYTGEKNEFVVKILDYTIDEDNGMYINANVFSKDGATRRLWMRNSTFPKNTGKHSWREIVLNEKSYKNSIDKMIPDFIDQLYAIDVDSMKGKLYRKKGIDFMQKVNTTNARGFDSSIMEHEEKPPIRPLPEGVDKIPTVRNDAITIEEFCEKYGIENIEEFCEKYGIEIEENNTKIKKIEETESEIEKNKKRIEEHEKWVKTIEEEKEKFRRYAEDNNVLEGIEHEHFEIENIENGKIRAVIGWDFGGYKKLVDLEYEEDENGNITNMKVVKQYEEELNPVDND